MDLDVLPRRGDFLKRDLAKAILGGAVVAFREVHCSSEVNQETRPVSVVQLAALGCKREPPGTRRCTPGCGSGGGEGHRSADHGEAVGLMLPHTFFLSLARDVDVFGSDLHEELQRACEMSPQPHTMSRVGQDE